MFDWIIGFIERTGYFGIAAMMLAENVFPPIPSELIMPLAGFTAARGELSIVGAVLVGSVGSVLGSTLWYFIGYWLGGERLRRVAARHGRWLTVTPDDIDAACAWFDRHGGKAVLIGRLVPAVRTLISVPAGIAKMPLLPFLVYSGIGTLVWTALLGAAGFYLETQYRLVGDLLDPVADVVIGILAVWYIYRVVTFGNKSRDLDRCR
ncbi:MAG: DedA family protein [Alphaproteobacteria bacterium]